MSRNCIRCGCVLGNSNWAEWARNSGHYICRGCYSKDRVKRTLISGIKEVQRAHDYYKTHKEQFKRQRERKKPKQPLYGRKYYQSHKQQASIEALARRLTALASSCSICGGNEKLERHHPDYTKPLEVITLCHVCHCEVHSGLKTLPMVLGEEGDP